MHRIIRRFWPIGIVFIVWILFISPYLFHGLVPFPSKYLVTFFPPWSAQYGMPVKNNAMPDVITQIYPWKKITIDSWKLGQVPLWNPYSFSGTPHAANYQTAVFSPVNILYFVLPFLDAWSVSILLQPLLAGIFMYVFLRSLNRSKEASLVGSIGFMFCGFLTVWMAYGTLGWAVLWLPLLLAAVLRHVNKREITNTMIISLGLAWSFFSGHFQMSMYVLLVLVAYIVYQTIRTKRLKPGLELGFAVGIGLMISAIQIIPSMEAYSKSVRSELFSQSGGIAWQYVVTLLSPDFYGNPVTRNDWFGAYAEWASYIGVLPLLMAIYAIIRRTKHIGFFLGLAIISYLIASSSPINELVIWLKIPAISTSYAARIIVIMSFSLIVVAAYGLDTLREDWETKKMSTIFPFIISILIILAGLWAMVVVVRPLPMDKLLIAKRNLVFPSCLALAGCICIICGFIKQKKIIARGIVILFILLTAADMLRYAAKWMPFDPREFVYPNVGVLSFLQKQVGHERMFGTLGGEVTNGFSLFGIEGYDAVYQKRYGEFIRSLADGAIIFPERSVVQFPKTGTFSEFALQLLSVRYIAHRLSDGRFPWAYPYWQFPYYTSVYRDNYYEVLANKSVLPRAFLASSYITVKGDQDILHALDKRDFNPRETLVLEREPVYKPEQGEGSIDILKYTPNEIVIKSTSNVPKLLFLSDVFDTGWQVVIDSKKDRLDRADFDFRSVAIPKGEHVVRMVYWPESFVYGLWIAAAGIGILVCGSVFVISRKLQEYA